MYSEFMTEVGSGRIPMAGDRNFVADKCSGAFLGRYYITRRRYETVSVKRVGQKGFREGVS